MEPLTNLKADIANQNPEDPNLTTDERNAIYSAKNAQLERGIKSLEDMQIKDQIRDYLQSKGFYNFNVRAADDIVVNTADSREYHVRIRPTSTPNNLTRNQKYVPIQDINQFKEWYEKSYHSTLTK